MPKLFITLMTAALLAMPVWSDDAKDDKEAFVKMMDSIDLNGPRNTSLSIKTNWTNLKGQEATFTATVVDVKGGRGKVQIYARKDGKPLYKGYNIILTSFDEMGAAKLRKGDTFTFKGMYEDKKQRRGGPLVIYFNNVQLIQKK